MQSLGLLVVLALSVAFVDSKPVTKDDEADADKEFEAWKIQFGKSYPSAEEESRRRSIWLGQKKIIEEHNKRAENGLETYTMGLNYFSDLESEEIPMGLGPLQEAPDLPQLSKSLIKAPPLWPTGNKPNRPKRPNPPLIQPLPEDAHPPPSQIPTTLPPSWT